MDVAVLGPDDQSSLIPTTGTSIDDLPKEDAVTQGALTKAQYPMRTAKMRKLRVTLDAWAVSGSVAKAILQITALTSTDPSIVLTPSRHPRGREYEFGSVPHDYVRGRSP